MTADEIRNTEFKLIPLDDEWGKLIGKACHPTSIFFYGKGGSGKSTGTLLLSEHLSMVGMTVLYVAAEQFGTPSFKDLLERLQILGGNRLQFVPDLKTHDITLFDVIVLDSKDALGIDVDEFRDLKKKFPGKTFLINSQGTKSGDFTGSAAWRNEVDTMVYCETGVLYTDRDKNRWGGKSFKRVF